MDHVYPSAPHSRSPSPVDNLTSTLSPKGKEDEALLGAVQPDLVSEKLRLRRESHNRVERRRRDLVNSTVTGFSWHIHRTL